MNKEEGGAGAVRLFWILGAMQDKEYGSGWAWFTYFILPM